MKLEYANGKRAKRQWSESDDKAYDKAKGLKEGSMADYRQDMKNGATKKQAMKGMTPADKKKVQGK